MIYIFPYLYHTNPDYHILQETWYAITGSCYWYSFFPNLWYIFPTLWLLIHLNYETTYQHPIDIIDIQRHDPRHSNSDCVNHIYYLCLIYVFQLFLICAAYLAREQRVYVFQLFLIWCNQIYTQYSASFKFHCSDLVFLLTWLF